MVDKMCLSERKKKKKSLAIAMVKSLSGIGANRGMGK